MKTLLKTGYWKIIDLFYREKMVKLHLREIVRRTKLNENSASRFLKQLEKEQILKSEKDGNLKKFSIKKNNVVYSMLTLFDISKINKLPTIRKNAISYFLDKLEIKPIIALVFGSTAKETFKDDSDVDILLIVNKKIDVEEAEKFADAQTGIRISTFQINYSDFLIQIKTKEDKVVASAINTGYPITNHISYYEAILNEN